MFPPPSPNRPSGPAVEERPHAEERVTRARVLRNAQVGAAPTDGTAAARSPRRPGHHRARRGQGSAALARRQLAQRHRRERQEREESASSRSLGSQDTADDDEASASDASAGTPEELAGAAAARRPQRAEERWTDGGKEAAGRTAHFHHHQELPASHPPHHPTDSNAGEQRPRGPPHAAPALAHASRVSRVSGPDLPPGEEPRPGHIPPHERAMAESAAADEHRRLAQVARAYSPCHLGASRAAQAARVRALWSQGGEAPSTGAGMGEMADMDASEHAIAARAPSHSVRAPQPLQAQARVLSATPPRTSQTPSVPGSGGGPVTDKLPDSPAGRGGPVTGAGVSDRIGARRPAHAGEDSNRDDDADELFYTPSDEYIDPTPHGGRETEGYYSSTAATRRAVLSYNSASPLSRDQQWLQAAEGLRAQGDGTPGFPGGDASDASSAGGTADAGDDETASDRYWREFITRAADEHQARDEEEDRWRAAGGDGEDDEEEDSEDYSTDPAGDDDEGYASTESEPSVRRGTLKHKANFTRAIGGRTPTLYHSSSIYVVPGVLSDHSDDIRIGEGLFSEGDLRLNDVVHEFKGILIGPGRYSRRNSRDAGGYIVGIREGNRASGGVQCAIYLDCGDDYAQGHCVASYANSPHRVVHAEHRTPAMANARLVVASSLGNNCYRVTLVAGSPSQVEALSQQTRPVVIYGGTSEILYSYSDSYRYPLHVGHDHGSSPGDAGKEEHAYDDEDDYDDNASEGQNPFP
ncbi:hypothetical protein B484DRAFT_405250 [Ochromonadaceae sp. CCMP2298]|nr:hypothetical protein B484DRAFT_405250 [Ochromonadaceae sp. CCMP2298]